MSQRKCPSPKKKCSGFLFKQKSTRSPCSRSEGFLKNQVHLFHIHCISHTLKQTVHPDAPKPSPFRWLQTFEWPLQTCVFRDFLPNLLNIFLIVCWISWTYSSYLIANWTPTFKFSCQILLAKEAHEPMNSSIAWSSGQHHGGILRACVWRQVLLEVVPLTSFTHPYNPTTIHGTWNLKLTMISILASHFPGVQGGFQVLMLVFGGCMEPWTSDLWFGWKV